MILIKKNTKINRKNFIFTNLEIDSTRKKLILHSASEGKVIFPNVR